jgi:hypothetical protein
MAGISGGGRVKETAHTAAGFTDQSQKRTMVKLRERPVFRGPPFYFATERLNAVFGAGDGRKALRAPGQAVFKGIPGKIRHIV